MLKGSANVHDGQLRYFTPDNQLLPTPEEAALEAQQQVLEAQQRALEAQQRANQLAEQLRALGIDPDV